MRIAKIFVSGEHKDAKFFEVVKVADEVKFDPRPGWVFVREADKIPRRAEVFWFHPDDVRFDWVKDFK